MNMKQFLEATGQNANIISLDLETTGNIQHPLTEVTQMGYHVSDVAGNTIAAREFAIKGNLKKRKLSDLTQEELDWMEAYNKGKAPNEQLTKHMLLKLPTEESLLRAHEATGAGAFGKKQLEAGSLKSVVDAYRDSVQVKNGKLSFKDGVATMQNAAYTLQKLTSKDPGLVLIQNVNFERQAFERSIDKSNNDIQSISAKAAASFNMAMYGQSSDHTMFSVSKQMQIGRSRFIKAGQELRGAYLSGSSSFDDKVQDVLRASDELGARVLKDIQEASSRGKHAVIDLMDVTASIQAKMYRATEGTEHAISPLSIGRARSIEILSSTLLGEAEKHTALSDAVQQTAIFRKLLTMSEELDNGVLSEDTLKYIKAINDPATYEAEYLKNFSNRLEEVEIEASTMKREGKSVQEIDAHIGKRLDSISKTLDASYAGLPMRESFDKPQITSNVSKFIQSGAVPLTDSEMADRDTLVKRITLSPDLGSPSDPHIGRAKKLGQARSALASMQAATDMLFSKAEIANSSKMRSPVEPEEIAKKLPKSVKIGGLLVGGMAAYEFLAPDPPPERASERLIKNDSYDALYNNLYVGQAEANWRERHGAHKTIFGG